MRLEALDERIEIVRSWPDMTGIDEAHFRQAEEKAWATGLLERYLAERATNPFLQLVVTPTFGKVAAMYRYACDRVREALENDGFRQLPETRISSGHPDDFGGRIKLLDGITPNPLGIAIEVVDLGAHWSENNAASFAPSEKRSSRSAHVQVLLAAAQNPDWVRTMNPDNGVPHVLMGGYVLTVPDSVGWEEWIGLRIRREGGGKRQLAKNPELCGYRNAGPLYYGCALAEVWTS